MTCCIIQDEDYKAAGATLVSDKEAFGADIVLKVRAPVIGTETDKFNPGSRLLTSPFFSIETSETAILREASLSSSSTQQPFSTRDQPSIQRTI